MVLMKSSLIFRELIKKYDMPEEDIQSFQSLNKDLSNLIPMFIQALSSIEEMQNLLLPEEAYEKLSETKEVLGKGLDSLFDNPEEDGDEYVYYEEE